MEGYPIARIWRDSRVQRIYGGTTEILKEVVSRLPHTNRSIQCPLLHLADEALEAVVSQAPGPSRMVGSVLGEGVSMTEAVRRFEAAEGIQVLQLHRPERLNALSSEVLQALHQALDDVATDATCRFVVLTGSGRGFCAGLDLVEHADTLSEEGARTPQQRMHLQKWIASLVPKLRGLPQPVIAAVNGPAAGGGLALALASDIRLAAPSARFDIAFMKIGLSACDIGVSWLLPRLIGASRAFEILLTGRAVGSDEAERIGLVSRVVPDQDVVEAAVSLAQEMAQHSPIGVRMTKEVMWSQLEVASLTAGIDMENRTQILTSFTSDQDEALAAFRERRQPVFRDR